MKEYVILVVVLVLVFVPNVMFRNYLDKSGKELMTIVKELQKNIEENEEINEADVNRLKDDFLAKEKIWILIVDHDMLDEIEYEVEDCVAQYHKETMYDFISSANRLCDEIDDLSKREEITWGNIL